jgi:hypothetical protein
VLFIGWQRKVIKITLQKWGNIRGGGRKTRNMKYITKKIKEVRNKRKKER